MKKKNREKKKISLITGIAGFAGSHLAEHLLKNGHEVWGIYRWRSKTENIDHIKSNLKLLEADLADYHSTAEAIAKVKPDYIFHLAAQSFVPASWSAPFSTMMVNVIGQINLFEAVRQQGITPVIHIACSSDEYGEIRKNELPIKETNPLRPLSPYAVSKATQDMMGYQYYKSFGLKIIRTRAFNHIGPRQQEFFVTSSLAKQIALIEKAKINPVIYVGNLQARRDFSDARDIVRAYLLAVQKCEFGEVYNVCSEKSYSIDQILKKLLSMSLKKIEVKTDQSKLRPSDNKIVLGNCQKFKAATGWKPEIPFNDTLKDLLDYWRNKLDDF